MTEDRTRALLELLYHVSREVATALDPYVLHTSQDRVIGLLRYDLQTSA